MFAAQLNNEVSCTEYPLLLSQHAIRALYLELCCYPKPGLVSFMDSGSHRDMDAQTFIKSLLSLQDYFKNIAEMGAFGAPLQQLKKLGLTAEASMLQATQGINTHRGAIFILGLLVAATAYVKKNVLRFQGIPDIIQTVWGQSLLQNTELDSKSHGAMMRKKFKIKSLITEAAQGFPILFQQGLPQLKQLLMQGLPREKAYLQLFFFFLSHIDDTNLLYRGGLQGLHFAKQAAHDFLSNGGVCKNDYLEKAISIHQIFIEKNLSPGGSADLLAATIFLYEIEKC